ncbi:MAG: cobaltochelatase subunit CobN [bacterium]
MHVVFRESHGLEETATPFDPAQDPADMVVLSFSDSDLGAFAAGWHRAAGRMPSLRLCNLVALRHPLSVDTYVEKTLSGAKAILVRLIGGEAYWPYGLTSLRDLAQRHNIALAVLPADGRPDPALDDYSTVPTSTLRRLTDLCDAGGAVAAQAALAQLALAGGLYAPPVIGEKNVPDHGLYLPGRGVVQSIAGQGPRVAVAFYRSYLTAADTDTIDALITALTEAGFTAYGMFVPSLKSASATWIAETLRQDHHAAVVNATAFSCKTPDGTTPLDAAGCPVFQIALSTARRRDWAEATRGLSPADLAMHVVLPEVDGRIFAGVASFKSPGRRDPDLQFARFAHRAAPDRIAAVVARVAGWANLATTQPADRQIAVILSTYPGRAHQMAHAVGLDALASTEALLTDLTQAGYNCRPTKSLAQDLQTQTESWPLAAYRAALLTLPETLQSDLQTTWGDPTTDPQCLGEAFHFPAIVHGSTLIALQPERGRPQHRSTDYHDLAATPRHAYVAFYLWLRARHTHAMVHMGAHGTLEWLPGKSVALSAQCWPEALTGATPVIYPFIVSDPGEAAQAKRRIGAVTLGHLPPPLAQSELPETFARLEVLLDEYSTADGIDPARRNRLMAQVRDEAASLGLTEDLNIPPNASPFEAMTQIDRFVCDIKESRFGDGLHIYGTAEGETAGLLAALNGQPVKPGPSGSPYRGRSDVLPTGRNLYSVDPRAVPSRNAHAQGVKLAEELIRRHLQDHGDYPRGLVVDLWGSATMRTSGEDFAMALHLAGLSLQWDQDSDRITGYEIIPLALLNRPRIDVTLRVSGLFRDIFPTLAQLFEAGTTALSSREEAPDDNPYTQQVHRVFAPEPGHYGLNMAADLDDFTAQSRHRAGEAWLTASAWAIGIDGQSHDDRAGLEQRVLNADSFVHAQDLAESDLLLASDYAAHEAGFAAAVKRLGGRKPALYHLDNTNPDTPRARSLTEEIARVVRARAANPNWASGMMRHGFRGGAEIAATLDHLAAFAHLAEAVPPHLFDLYHDATLGRDDLVAFLTAENPAALAGLQATFQRLHDAGLWTTRRNSIAARLVAQ